MIENSEPGLILQLLLELVHLLSVFGFVEVVKLEEFRFGEEKELSIVIRHETELNTSVLKFKVSEFFEFEAFLRILLVNDDFSDFLLIFYEDSPQNNTNLRLVL